MRRTISIKATGARRWLDGEPLETIQRQPPEKRRMRKVGRVVNSWKSQGPDLIRPSE
ncbi:hypothetical protein [Neotabrizicola sp. sgz301269]|uniref:hypothetical protein n=1 Tax=Neotabrizicola sp. sgz301269 TaxID=3276282 RepID=UPI00376F63FC